MPRKPAPKVRLVDAPDEFGRTTASLVSSLAMRLLTLHYTSGVSVVGSLRAGVAAAGREVAKTIDGMRLKQALLASQAGKNGEMLWAALRIGDWASGLPPSPVLDHIRNDLALLLAEDLSQSLSTVPMPGESRALVRDVEPQPVTFIDCILGLWIHSREIVNAVELIAATAPNGPPPRGIVDMPDETSGRRLLR
jgi:hypothetical protein